MMWIVAVHKFWPNSHYTGGPEKHVGFQTEAEARAYAESLERPAIGYVYRVTEP